MNDAGEQRLADCLHRELRQLPGHQAPATLAPRVRAALAARRRASSWSKSWADWPLGLRLAFLTFGVALAGALILAGWQLPSLSTGAAGVMDSASGWLSGLKPYVVIVFRLGDALWATVKGVPPHLLWVGVAMVGLAYGTCVGLGTLGYRVALNRI